MNTRIVAAAKHGTRETRLTTDFFFCWTDKRVLILQIPKGLLHLFVQFIVILSDFALSIFNRILKSTKSTNWSNIHFITKSMPLKRSRIPWISWKKVGKEYCSWLRGWWPTWFCCPTGRSILQHGEPCRKIRPCYVTYRQSCRMGRSDRRESNYNLKNISKQFKMT